MWSGTRGARVVPIALVIAMAVGPLAPLAPRIAQAAPSDPSSSTPDGAELRKRGNDAMAAFRPGEALEDYKQAYELTRDPALLYNMARALEALEDYPEALARYEDFSRLASADLRAKVPKLDELMASLRTRVSRLTITCNVPDARVIFREKTVGQTVAHGQTLVLPLSAGKGVLEVVADGYISFQRTLDLPGGGNLGIDVELVPKAVAGLLVVGSEPGGGDVFVDGRELGVAPVEASVGPGNHRVAVRLPGYSETSTTVVVSVGERRVVTVRLGQGSPITQKWWFWTAIGAAVVTGAVVTYAALTEKGPDSGSIQPGKTGAP
jgi:hypothetical protein